jgi:hypothetical protein
MGDHAVQQVAVVGDDHHRAGVLVDQALQVGLAGQVQVVVGLVQQQHVGAGQDQAGQADQLLLPAGEALHRSVEIPLVQAQAAQQLLHPGRVAVSTQLGIFFQVALLLVQSFLEGFQVVVDERVAQAGFDPL